jgi:Domain of unknown function (DUF6457)
MDELDPSVTEWVSQYAEAVGVTAPTPEEVDTILQLAAVAARASQRQAAPITCWLAARSGVTVRDALDTATRLQSS